MIAFSRLFVPHPRAGGMNALLAAVMAVILAMAAPLTAVAQEAAPPEQPATTAPAAPEQTGPVAPQPETAQEGVAGDAPSVNGGAASSPAAGDTPPVRGSSTESQLDVPMDVESAATPSAPEPATAGAEPAPSFLEDPAGAVSHILSSERDTGLPHDLSPWGMFMAADWVVKAVMIGLALASLGVWTVWLAKTVEIACAKARARRAAGVIASTYTLADASHKLSSRGGPAAFMVRSAEDELRRSSTALDHAGNDGVKERLGARLARIEAQAGRRLSRGTGLLATVGSTAPFIGLFGTVWGIMNAFIGISEAQTTNLAVVAPGIAEALLATAIGLVAAIPAVIVYNVFARSIAGYGQLLADAASGVEQLVSLDLDLRKVPVPNKSLALEPAAAASGPLAERPKAERPFETTASAAE